MAEAELITGMEGTGLFSAEEAANSAPKMLENAAADIEEDLPNIIKNAAEDGKLADVLAEQGARSGDTSVFNANMDNKNAIAGPMATKGIAGAAEAAGEMSTQVGKDLVTNTSALSDIKAASEQAVTNAGGKSVLLTWLAEHPGYVLLGMGVVALGIYLAVEAAMGVSPADALNNLASTAGAAARDIAAFTGGLANSFAQGLFGNLWPYIKYGLIIIGIIIALVVAWKLVNKFSNKGSSPYPPSNSSNYYPPTLPAPSIGFYPK